MILSLEQILIDIEIYRMNRQAHRGILTSCEKWLDDVIMNIGPAGNYLGERSTVTGIRSGTWLVDRMGVHEPLQSWEDTGRLTINDEAREQVDRILETHQSLPFHHEVEQALMQIHKKAKTIRDG